MSKRIDWTKRINVDPRLDGLVEVTIHSVEEHGGGLAYFRLTVDEAEEVAQTLLAVCQDIRRRELECDAERHEEWVSHV